MEACVPLPISARLLERITQQAKDYLVSHGAVLRTASDRLNPDIVTHAPVTLLPSPVPRRLYDHAQRIQGDINLLMHKVACDRTFLKRCLENVIGVDDFTARLWNIYETVSSEGMAQQLQLGLIRSDYMFDCGKPTTDVINSGATIKSQDTKIQQIEINMIASSFGGLCQQLDGFHRFMLGRLQNFSGVSAIPENKALEVLAAGMVESWKAYGCNNAVILFLIQSDEGNIYDQRLLEYAVYEVNPKIQVIRRSITDLTERARLVDGKLLIDDLEVCLVYQRSLYAPDNYTSEKDWDTRLLIERSRAIKCPSAGYHLAGTKKVQQVLCQDPHVMDEYIGAEAAARIRETFAEQYSLDLTPEGDRAVAMAMSDPERFVLKPQREGGGNNTFGKGIPGLLADMKPEERSAYILMRYIHPAPLQNYMLRAGQPLTLANCVSELGVFGAFLARGSEVLLNRSGGHILRTKAVDTMEGGVATGFSCLDSPYLTD